MTFLEIGPVHEAFVAQEYGLMVSRAIDAKPPAPLQEIPPENPDKDLVWIKGYWEWSESLKEFIWVSGIWRRPPPEHHWIEGEWQEFDRKWIRLPGFWTKENVRVVPQPPDPIDEFIPEARADNYFWILGHWKFDPIYERYDWWQGRWQLFNANWIYVPGHYVWHKEGYVFVEGYWDWKVEERGKLYQSVRVPEEKRGEPITPSQEMTAEMILVSLFPYWPNYLYFYQTIYHFHPEFWREWGVEIPWWPWKEWWGLTWKDQLWLWWWWSHPGYREPDWLYLKLAEEITPPSQGIKKMMEEVPPLLNITPEGVVGENLLLEKLYKVMGKKVPYVSKEMEKELERRVTPHDARRPFLFPEGINGFIQAPHKPYFGPRMDSLTTPPKRIFYPLPPTYKVEEIPLPPKRVRREAEYPRSNVDEKRKWPRNHKLDLFPHSNIEEKNKKENNTIPGK